MIRFIPKSDYNNIDIELPSSKSISNRVLLIDFIRDGMVSNRVDISQSEDTLTLIDILTHLERGDETAFEIGNNGAVCRFLIPLLATTRGIFTLDGDDRMRRRPIMELVEAMNSLGASIVYLDADGCLPILINGNDSIVKDYVEVDCSRSSQFVSALMLITPRLQNGLRIKMMGEITSVSYIMMTFGLMIKFGVNMSFDNNEILIHSHQAYNCEDYMIEKDWSSASYWYLAISLLPINTSLFLKGLAIDSLQGDKIISQIATICGVESVEKVGGVEIKKTSSGGKYIELDCTTFPDLVPTIVVACSALNIVATLHGVEVLKYKESNRLESLIHEMKHIDSSIEYEEDGKLSIYPRFCKQNNHFNSYDDHRLVMSFVPLVMLFGDVSVENTSVIDKSYPRFFDEMKKIGVFKEAF